MINANKSKIPYSTKVRKMESDLEFISEIRAPPKVNQFFRLVSPVITPTFNEIGSLLFQ